MSKYPIYKINVPLYIEVQTKEFETNAEELQKMFMDLLLEIDDGRRNFGAELLTHGAERMLDVLAWYLADKEVVRRNLPSPIGKYIEKVLENTKMYIRHYNFEDL